ncbi:MAG: long-chain-fatty-acid--CoA ligase [Chloroflexi bacterium]|nr:long-chain-fatty-acid--CoA ligase [Chloroflexota bacterium]
MTYTTIGSVLAANLESNPDREALIFREQRYTYRQLGEQADRVAQAFVKLGIRKGDHVAVDLPNWPEFVFAYFALMRIGAAIVLVNPRYRQTELAHILRDSDSVAILLPVEFENFQYLPMMQRLRAELPDLRHVIAVGEKKDSESGVLYFDELMAHASDKPVPEANIDPAQDLAFLMYTSGTTGKPKGAMVTHANFVRTTEVAVEPFGITDADVFLVLVPVTHIIGLFCLNSAFFNRAKVILLDVFKAEPVAQLIEREKVTAQYAVPTVFTLELAQADRYDISSLRTGLIAGASVPAELLRRLVALNIQVHPQYGMTETSGGLTTTSVDDNLVDRTETVGRALPGVEIKLVDDNRRPVPEAQVGEIAVKSQGLMKGYYKQPEATAAAFDGEGWFYTGDLGCRDERGYIRIVGRKKDMIIRGGYNIYPREIEDLLFTCPGVQEVAIIGVPDPVLGEKTCACIGPQPGARLTEAEIKDFCRGKIADYKVPDYVRFVESFPLTATGKVYKAMLKEQVNQAMTMTTL